MEEKRRQLVEAKDGYGLGFNEGARAASPCDVRPQLLEACETVKGTYIPSVQGTQCNAFAQIGIEWCKPHERKQLERVLTRIPIRMDVVSSASRGYRLFVRRIDMAYVPVPSYPTPTASESSQSNHTPPPWQAFPTLFFVSVVCIFSVTSNHLHWLCPTPRRSKCLVGRSNSRLRDELGEAPD